jgi:hypothetical protein
MRASRENEVADGTRHPNSPMDHVLREVDTALGLCRSELYPTKTKRRSAWLSTARPQPIETPVIQLGEARAASSNYWTRPRALPN